MTNQAPAYQAYTVVKREGADDFWLSIGAAFEHSDHKGYNLVLQALPIDGKVVLRVPKEERDERSSARPDNRERSATNTNRSRRS